VVSGGYVRGDRLEGGGSMPPFSTGRKGINDRDDYT